MPSTPEFFHQFFDKEFKISNDPDHQLYQVESEKIYSFTQPSKNLFMKKGPDGEWKLFDDWKVIKHLYQATAKPIRGGGYEIDLTIICDEKVADVLKSARIKTNVYISPKYGDVGKKEAIDFHFSIMKESINVLKSVWKKNFGKFTIDVVSINRLKELLDERKKDFASIYKIVESSKIAFKNLTEENVDLIIKNDRDLGPFYDSIGRHTFKKLINRASSELGKEHLKQVKVIESAYKALETQITDVVKNHGEIYSVVILRSTLLPEEFKKSNVITPQAIDKVLEINYSLLKFIDEIVRKNKTVAKIIKREVHWYEGKFKLLDPTIKYLKEEVD